MLGCSLFWALFLWNRDHDHLMNLFYPWLFSAWEFFAVGALLACLLPRWMRGQSQPAAVGMGLCVGIVTGLIMALGVWLALTQGDLIGLVINRASGGYQSYSYSVRLNLQKQAWDILTTLAPLTSVWVAVWAVWTNRILRFSPNVPINESSSAGIELRVDRQVVLLVAGLAVGIAIIVTAGLMLTQRGGGSLGLRLFLIGPVTGSLVVLGPWLGPMINPSGMAGALKCTAVALPALLAALAPFVFRQKPVRPFTAVVAWCGLVTALLFWTAAGVLSAGASMG